MYLPHLTEQRHDADWTANKRRELKIALLEAIDLAGPEYVLDVLAEARAEWGCANFETANLQREYHIGVIEEAAEKCRLISEVRFAIEGRFGFNPTRTMFDKILGDMYSTEE